VRKARAIPCPCGLTIDDKINSSCEVSTISPPLMGGDEGEDEMKHKITPTLTSVRVDSDLPHQWGGNKRKTRSSDLRDSLD